MIKFTESLDVAQINNTVCRGEDYVPPNVKDHSTLIFCENQSSTNIYKIVLPSVSTARGRCPISPNAHDLSCCTDL